MPRILKTTLTAMLAEVGEQAQKLGEVLTFLPDDADAWHEALDGFTREDRAEIDAYLGRLSITLRDLSERFRYLRYRMQR